ncbi:MAG: stage V sporulation protein AC [Thomasclavelia sp.]
MKKLETSKYNQVAEKLKPQKKVWQHCLSAFIYGGIIGAIGQGLLDFYMNIFNISEEEASPMMVITLVLIAAILTGMGIYDRLGKRAGAGTFIPITGFANSMTSSALEAKSEGLVTGIGANMFKLGGTVITFGIVASFILGGIRYVFSLIG